MVDDWGDGLITDPAILRAHPLASDPNPFFRTLLTKPYLNQVLCLQLAAATCSVS